MDKRPYNPSSTCMPILNISKKIFKEREKKKAEPDKLLGCTNCEYLFPPVFVSAERINLPCS